MDISRGKGYALKIFWRDLGSTLGSKVNARNAAAYQARAGQMPELSKSRGKKIQNILRLITARRSLVN